MDAYHEAVTAVLESKRHDAAVKQQFSTCPAERFRQFERWNWLALVCWIRQRNLNRGPCHVPARIQQNWVDEDEDLDHQARLVEPTENTGRPTPTVRLLQVQ